MQLPSVEFTLFHNLLSGICEEMGVALTRSSFSPNIKERRDFSCALFDAQGRMVAQGAHLPVHLGSMPMSVASAIERFTFAPGDVVILNDPYAGGTHLPDITIVTPVFISPSPRPAIPPVSSLHRGRFCPSSARRRGAADSAWCGGESAERYDRDRLLLLSGKTNTTIRPIQNRPSSPSGAG